MVPRVATTAGRPLREDEGRCLYGAGHFIYFSERLIMRSKKTSAVAPVTPSEAFQQLCINLFRYFAMVGFWYIFGKYGDLPNAYLFDYATVFLLLVGCVYTVLEFAAFRKKTSPPAPEVAEAPSA